MTQCEGDDRERHARPRRKPGGWGPRGTAGPIHAPRPHRERLDLDPPHDTKFRFGPPAGDNGDEVERDDDQQRPADAKTREAADKQRKRKVVHVTVGRPSEDIDAEIAPLIRATWEADIETVLAYPCDCCRRVCIMFPTQKDAAAFLNAVGRFEPGKNSLYNRINQERVSDDSDRD